MQRVRREEEAAFQTLFMVYPETPEKERNGVASKSPAMAEKWEPLLSVLTFPGWHPWCKVTESLLPRWQIAVSWHLSYLGHFHPISEGASETLKHPGTVRQDLATGAENGWRWGSVDFSVRFQFYHLKLSAQQSTKPLLRLITNLKIHWAHIIWTFQEQIMCLGYKDVRNPFGRNTLKQIRNTQTHVFWFKMT